MLRSPSDLKQKIQETTKNTHTTTSDIANEQRLPQHQEIPEGLLCSFFLNGSHFILGFHP